MLENLLHVSLGLLAILLSACSGGTGEQDVGDGASKDTVAELDGGGNTTNVPTPASGSDAGGTTGETDTADNGGNVFDTRDAGGTRADAEAPSQSGMRGPPAMPLAERPMRAPMRRQAPRDRCRPSWWVSGKRRDRRRVTTPILRAWLSPCGGPPGRPGRGDHFVGNARIAATAAHLVVRIRECDQYDGTYEYDLPPLNAFYRWIYFASGPESINLDCGAFPRNEWQSTLCTVDQPGFTRRL